MEANGKVGADETILEANAAFTRGLYQALSETNDGNIFFSPISIHAILSLAAQGTAGTTRKAVCKSLHVSGAEVLAEGYKILLTQLNSVEGVDLMIVNKVFLMTGYELQDSFRHVVTDSFLAEVDNVNFAHAEIAAGQINDWVDRKTHSKIRHLVSAGDMDAQTRLVLVNAIYFKGNWLHKFLPENTTVEKFYKMDGNTVDVQMMHQSRKFYFKYDEMLDAKILELPYTNKNVSMILILPTERDGIAELEDRLADLDIGNIMENMHLSEVVVALPKFKIEHTVELNEPLAELGFEEIFDEQRADFSAMLKSPERLVVSKVIQKAVIEVNEEGAEAAAATAMIMVACCSISIPIQPVPFIADHPFLAVLQYKDKTTAKPTTMFQGRVSLPSY